jgi:hypothetical protein
MGGYTEIIWLLAGGDITKKEIYKLNCHEFLYWAAYMIDKRKVEVARLEKIMINVLNSYAVTTQF